MRDTKLLAQVARDVGRWVKGGRSWVWPQKLWCKYQLPWRPHFSEYDVGRDHGLGIRAVEMGKVLMGRHWMTVRAFVVHGGGEGDVRATLVDSGLACMAPRLATLAGEWQISKCVVTHHHEDHSGGVAALHEAGIPVYASAATSALLQDVPSRDSDGLPLRFYQHLLWSQAPACSGVHTLDRHVEVAGEHATVMDVPGHCDDQVAFHLPERGVLFSGDAFIHERPKYFRSDEDWHSTVNSLRQLVRLDFDHLLCAHRPRVGSGKTALLQKLQWFEDLQGRVEELHARGWSDTAIVAEVLPRTWFAIGQEVLTLWDLSSLNLVQSILYGPVTRPEVDDVLRRIRASRLTSDFPGTWTWIRRKRSST